MIFDVLTLFPELFGSFKEWSIIGRAINKGLISINCVNIRDFSQNKHKKVDDYPYGGGHGMVMTPDPIFRAIQTVKSEHSKIIYLSPQGRKLNQEIVKELSECEKLVLLCGHYEGIDNRIVENYIDDEISIGDYVLTGGEIPAMVLIEAVTRLIPLVLSKEDAYLEESHQNGKLEFPQYTRPRVYNGHSVPEVLLSGNHKEIEQWKIENSLKTTKIKRPDLLNDKDGD